jgi:hypothetical protein
VSAGRWSFRGEKPTTDLTMRPPEPPKLTNEVRPKQCRTVWLPPPQLANLIHCFNQIRTLPFVTSCTLYPVPYILYHPDEFHIPARSPGHGGLCRLCIWHRDLVGGLASLFFTLGPSTRSNRQFTFTCLDIDLSTRRRLRSTADPT